TKKYKNQFLPFPFILAPAGKRNEQVLKNVKNGEVLKLIVDGEYVGHIKTKSVYKIDRKKRIKAIFGTDDETHPGVKDTLKRLGKYAISGEYDVIFDDIKIAKKKIKDAKEAIDAQKTTAIMMAAKPLHRAHERLIRITLENTDLLVLFLLKPYKQDILSYEIRLKTLEYFVDNFLPKNRVVIVPFENTYIFAGYNNAVLDSIAAKNFGCNEIVLGQNHSGIGIFYDHDRINSILDSIEHNEIGVKIVNEFVYCNQCKTLVSTKTCPHGKHHHISYHSPSILELLKSGLLPPAVLVRKEISAILLSELFKNRFKDLGKLYDAIMPGSGLLEEHDEKDFYIKLLELYQTTSLT
ncbi:MAG: sulfate adenylyltransferase, partial [Epsilonproteobacteria bacterium]|nr:sulfate adenylyltransferase [Campylobacterota bacterium]